MPGRPSPAVAVCVAAALVVGCASESEPDGSAGGDSVSAYLGQLPVPADDDVVVVTYADVARAAEIAGLERPRDVADDDASFEYLTAIAGLTEDGGEPAEVAAILPSITEPAYRDDLPGFVDDVGWSVLEVDSYAALDMPPRRVSQLDGSFDREVLDEALADAGDDAWVAGDPDGEIDLDSRTPARPLGQALWLALDGDRLTVADKEDDLRAAREADGGEGTLADDPVLAPLAAALDGHDVYSAMLMSDPGLSVEDPAGRVLGELATPEQIEALDLDPCPGLVGAAAGVADDGEPLLVYATAHADEDSAEDSVDIITEAFEEGSLMPVQRPWADILTIESVEADGTTVVVTARPADMVLGQWSNFVVDRSFPPC